MARKRLAVYAHYDAKGVVRPYVLYYLRRLREECDRIAFVSTADLPAAEIDKVRPFCADALLKDNVGMDFGMWAHALGRVDLGAWDELVLTNSSVFGPLRSLAASFQRMDASPCDFWGMTDNTEIAWHLQSYFLVFRKRVLESDAFRRFFASVLPYRDKEQIIRSYEVGLTIFLSGAGFRPAALAPVAALAPFPFVARVSGKPRRNPTGHHPVELLDLGMPFVKVETLRDNPGCIRLDPLVQAMEDAGYDMSLVEFDRPPKRALPGLTLVTRVPREDTRRMNVR